MAVRLYIVWRELARTYTSWMFVHVSTGYLSIHVHVFQSLQSVCTCFASESARPGVFRNNSEWKHRNVSSVSVFCALPLCPVGFMKRRHCFLITCMQRTASTPSRSTFTCIQVEFGLNRFVSCFSFIITFILRFFARIL